MTLSQLRAEQDPMLAGQRLESAWGAPSGRPQRYTTHWHSSYSSYWGTVIHIIVLQIIAWYVPMLTLGTLGLLAWWLVPKILTWRLTRAAHKRAKQGDRTPRNQRR